MVVASKEGADRQDKDTRAPEPRETETRNRSLELPRRFSEWGRKDLLRVKAWRRARRSRPVPRVCPPQHHPKSRR